MQRQPPTLAVAPWAVACCCTIGLCACFPVAVALLNGAMTGRPGLKAKVYGILCGAAVLALQRGTLAVGSLRVLAGARAEVADAVPAVLTAAQLFLVANLGVNALPEWPGLLGSFVNPLTRSLRAWVLRRSQGLLLSACAARAAGVLLAALSRAVPRAGAGRAARRRLARCAVCAIATLGVVQCLHAAFGHGVVGPAWGVAAAAAGLVALPACSRAARLWLAATAPAQARAPGAALAAAGEGEAPEAELFGPRQERDP